MGTDAFLFAERSKRCFYFDRKTNFMSYESDDHFDELKDRLNDKERISALEVIWMCNFNIVRKHRAAWNRDIMRFVVRTPDYHTERFFVVSDHDSPYSHDVIEEGGYVREKFPAPLYWQRRVIYRKRKHKKSERLMTAEYKALRDRQMIDDLERALSAGFTPGVLIPAGFFNTSKP